MIVRDLYYNKLDYARLIADMLDINATEKRMYREQYAFYLIDCSLMESTPISYEDFVSLIEIEASNVNSTWTVRL